MARAKTPMTLHAFDGFENAGTAIDLVNDRIVGKTSDSSKRSIPKNPPKNKGWINLKAGIPRSGSRVVSQTCGLMSPPFFAHLAIIPSLRGEILSSTCSTVPNNLREIDSRS